MDYTGDFFGSVFDDAKGVPSAAIQNEMIGGKLDECK